MCNSFAFILSLGVLVPSLISALSNFSEGSQSRSNDEERKPFDVKENENIASNELTPVERKVIAVQDMIDQLNKYNSFWNKLSTAKSQESIEETSEEIPEPEKNPSEKRKRIKYVKKKSKKSKESIESDSSDESDSVEENTGSVEDMSLSDDSNMVPTQIREKGNIFPKKRLKDDSSVSNSQISDSGNVDYQNDKNSKDYFMDTETSDDLKASMENSYNSEEGNYHREKKIPSKKLNNSEQKKSSNEKPSQKIIEEKNKQDEFENQLKGQKEIAEPIMFKNRSDGHTTHKPLASLLKVNKDLLMEKYLPTFMELKSDTSETKREFKIPDSDEDLSQFSVQATHEFRDETPEAPPYDFRREANQDLLNSDESYVGAELLDDESLDTKSSAFVAPSSDEHDQSRKNLDLLVETDLKDFNTQSSEETTKNKDTNGNDENEDEKNNEQESKENELGSNDETALGKSNGGLGRYHRIREVSRQVAM